MEIRRRLRHLQQAFSLSRDDIGLGGRQDKTTSLGLSIPWHTRTESGLDRWHKNSWICRDVVNKPAEDIAIKWRVFDPDDQTEETALAIRDAELRHEIKDRVCDAIWKARLYGGALMCIISNEANLMTPLNVNKFRKGSLQNLHVVNRFRATPEDEIQDVTDPHYGKPEYYHIWDGWSDYMIHHSRVIRFNAQLFNDRATTWGWNDYRWADSVLHAMIEEVERDMAMAQSASHLVLESSIKILEVQNLDQRRSGKSAGNESNQQTLTEMLRQIGREISVFNTLVIDKGKQEAKRLEARIFAGLNFILEIQAQRVSGSTGIPATILWGKSPSGMNATGDSDNTIYQRLLDVIQWRMADPALHILDPILAADSGASRKQMEEIPPHIWPTLTEKNALTEAQAFETRVKGMSTMLNDHTLDEDEYRRLCQGIRQWVNWKARRRNQKRTKMR